MSWPFFGRSRSPTAAPQGGAGGIRTSTVRNKYWKANVAQFKDEDGETTYDKNAQLAKMSNSSRPFLFIGDYDPGEPRPWPEEEADWWSLHETLARNVRASDALRPSEFDIDESRLPQLVFYGDSITEGWGGTTFGNVPGPHRMWTPDEPERIRDAFAKSFGEDSAWGKRALKPPLVLGISGSRTYDFIWRIRNGEFPTSRLLGGEGEEEEEDDDAVQNMFRLEKLERIYVVLMGTNNIGGGMLPGPTAKGMDAVGRAILQFHQDNFPNTPSAMLFSELLPRRDDFRAARMCPPRCKNETTLEPFESFGPAIDRVNRELPEVVDGWRKDYENSRIVLLSSSSHATRELQSVEENSNNDDNDEEEEDDELEEDEEEDRLDLDDDYSYTIDCGREMFAMEDEDEFDAHMPDRLHPNAKGYELWARCLRKGLEVVMDHAVTLTTEEERRRVVENK